MPAATEIRVPDIGDFKDVPVIEVLVKPGDAVKKNDSLIVLESDKAAMEVPSPQEGVVQNVSVKPGDKVSQGSVILSLQSADRAPENVIPSNAGVIPSNAGVIPSNVEGPRASETSREKQPSAHDLIQLTVPDIGDFKDVPVIEVLIKPGDAIEKDASIVVLESDKASMEVPASAGGTIEDVRVNVGDKVSQGMVIATVRGEQRLDKVAVAAQQTPQPAQAQAVRAPSGNGAIHASPSIRRFARELGVNLDDVQPTGPNGRITRDDVQSFVKRALQDGHHGAASASSMGGLQIAAWPKVDFAQFGEIERKPLTRIQKLSGPYLHRNWVMIPHVTQNDDADVTDLEEFRKQLNAEQTKPGVKITMLAFLMKASIAALKKFPKFNSSLDGDDLVLKRYYHIGFAADTPQGLVVPVIRDADRKGIAEVAAETSQLAAKARDGKLTSADMQGGTFTISSLGSIGGTYFTPIINAPEVAILGACRASIRPVWQGSAFVPRLIQPLSLSYDHRVIDGAAAARFTAYLAQVLSDLRRALI
jgi:pyruvate dehydrogenase E2 component (dihydrolipoamide acetyltransferase)